MNGDGTDARTQTPQQLAGACYNAMLSSFDATLAYLNATNIRLRLAALLLCVSHWSCGRDLRVARSALEIAESDCDDGCRVVAVNVVGRLFSGSKDCEISYVMAKLVLSNLSSYDLRLAAYWSLRDVQFGLSDTDFDTFLKRVVCDVKSILRLYPGKFCEESVKANLTAGDFPPGFWESAESIDWQFVRRFDVN